MLELPRSEEDRKLYYVTVRWGGNPRAVYVRGVFHDEAVVLKNNATKLGYKYASIHPQAEQRPFSSRETAGSESS